MRNCNAFTPISPLGLILSVWNVKQHSRINTQFDIRRLWVRFSAGTAENLFQDWWTIWVTNMWMFHDIPTQHKNLVESYEREAYLLTKLTYLYRNTVTHACPRTSWHAATCGNILVTQARHGHRFVTRAVSSQGGKGSWMSCNKYHLLVIRFIYIYIYYSSYCPRHHPRAI